MARTWGGLVASAAQQQQQKWVKFRCPAVSWIGLVEGRLRPQRCHRLLMPRLVVMGRFLSTEHRRVAISPSVCTLFTWSVQRAGNANGQSLSHEQDALLGAETFSTATTLDESGYTGAMFGLALRQRRLTPEAMDQPGLDEREHARALAGLARINGWSGSAGILWPALLDQARRTGTRGLRVLDVATGGGDVPLRLWRKARRAGVRIAFAGCDRSPVAIRIAHQRAACLGADVAFFQHDAVHEPLPAGYDAITCSLFLHHLDGRQATELLRRLAGAAERQVLVNDLARGWFGYLLAWTGTRLLSRSRIVHADGPLSVAAAFTPAEAATLAKEAGMTGVCMRRRWPCRFLLQWTRPDRETP